MLVYKCYEGQSFTDVCLNTYGSLDYYVKMLNDNGISPEDEPVTSQIVNWDNQLVANQAIQTNLTQNKIIFATLKGKYTINSIIPVNMYKDVIQASYTATTEGETVVTITALQNNEIIQVTKGILPLKATEYTFSASTGVITLVGVELGLDETLFVLYKKTIS